MIIIDLRMNKICFQFLTKQHNRWNFSIASFQSHHRYIFSIGTSRIKSHFYITSFYYITHACTIKLLKISGIIVTKKDVLYDQRLC